MGRARISERHLLCGPLLISWGEGKKQEAFVWIPTELNLNSGQKTNKSRSGNMDSSGNTNLALAVFGCLWESLIVFANDWVHFRV